MKRQMVQRFVLLALVACLLLPATVSARQYLAPAPLSQAEKDSLAFMREEEKLARDVYIFFYEEYRIPIFSNIARSEQRHTDAIKTLLDRYGLPDPAAGKKPGEFENDDLQSLYNELIARGTGSLAEALRVGVFIEETDIADLQDALLLVNHNDIKTVYLNLLSASTNHLKAFTSTLAKYGFPVEP